MTLGWCCRGCDFGRPCEFSREGKVLDNVYARTFGEAVSVPGCRCMCHTDGDANHCGNCPR
jgi:hypothetical protein